MQDILRGVGVAAEIVLAPRESSSFGNAIAVLAAAPILFRFTRDRGEVFVDIAPGTAPDDYCRFEDVEVLMGLASRAEIFARPLESPSAVAGKIAANLSELDEMFSAERTPTTLASLRIIASQREVMMARRLVGKPGE